MRAALVAAAVAVLVGVTGCRDTVWPSDAHPQEFCEAVTGRAFTEGEYDDLRSLGTPEDFPHEARRYLLDLADADDTDPADEAAFASYVDSHCG